MMNDCVRMLDWVWIGLFAVSVPDYRGAVKQRKKAKGKTKWCFESEQLLE